MKNKKELGIAVIGCGQISGNHIRAIREIPGASLTGVYDAVAGSAARKAEEYSVRCYESAKDIYNDPEVGAVCICTPSGTHAALALEALRNGRHVLVEKPMALNVKDCDEIIALAESTGLKAGVVSQLRFSPDVQRLKRELENNVFGKLISVELNMKYYREEEYYSRSSWRGTWAMDGGGALMNQGIHGCDLLQYLVGMPESVYAEAATLRHAIETEDTINSLLRFPQGALGVIMAGTSMWPGFPRRLTICGENGSVILEEDRIVYHRVLGEENTECTETDAENAAAGYSGAEGTHSAAGAVSLDGHVRQIGNFVRSVNGQEPLLIDAAEGKKAVALICAIYQSAKERREERI